MYNLDFSDNKKSFSVMCYSIALLMTIISFTIAFDFIMNLLGAKHIVTTTLGTGTSEVTIYGTNKMVVDEINVTTRDNWTWSE